MATERQILANRANALKSTGPITPEGKRISSQNAAHRPLIAGTVVLKGESTRRFNQIADALMLQFRPRNASETALVQVMAAAHWRLLRTWGIQTAAFELEMASARQKADPSAAAGGAVLAAIAFRAMADTSKALALQLRLETGYHRQFNQALSMLLKLRALPDTNFAESPVNLTTETWSDDDLPEDNLTDDAPADDDQNAEDSSNKPNSEPAPPAEPAIETTRCHHNPRRSPTSNGPDSRACNPGASPRQPAASLASTQPAQPGSARADTAPPRRNRNNVKFSAQAPGSAALSQIKSAESAHENKI